MPEKLKCYQFSMIIVIYVGRVSFLIRSNCLRNFKSLRWDKDLLSFLRRGRARDKRGKRQWQENRWDTSATWRVRFPVSESTEASSRSMYISRSPQSWSLPDSLSRLRIILIRITVWSLCNKPSSSITCAAETKAGNALPTQSVGSSYPFRNHKRRKVNMIMISLMKKWEKLLKKLISLVY